MVTAFDYSTRSSVHVAPLAIHKNRTRSSSRSWKHQRTSSTSTELTTSSSTASSQITPPTTPNGSQEDLRRYMEPSQPVFHNFLRAFYPFQPTYTVSNTTVTVPLNEGDLILVHSIHTNGWADGTLLPSGARGWLPTNYCVAYEPESMQNLLVALLNFWDLLRHGVMSDAEVARNQEIMRGVIAGVRKALLSELSSLVKSAKKLQDIPITSSEAFIEEINDTIDDMIMKAFKLVVRGVRFLDSWEDEMTSHPPVHAAMATVIEESHNPPTPPADAASFDRPTQGKRTYEMASRRLSTYSFDSGVSSSQLSEDTTKYEPYRRMSIHSNTTASSSRPLSISRPASLHVKRQSISHRMSMVMPAAQRQNLVSERLNACHDTFLSFLGSFIGRLHLQSQSSAGLLLTTRESVAAGTELLGIVEEICAHDSQSADTLHITRNALYDHLNKLEASARDIIQSTGFEEDDVVMPHQNGSLLMAATACVKAAGECVAKSKFVIERIGDFEFERSSSSGLEIDGFQVIPSTNPESILPEPTKEFAQTELAKLPPPLVIANTEKPLPELPPDSPMDINTPDTQQSLDSRLEGTQLLSQNSTSQPTRSSSLLPPLPKLTTSGSSQEESSQPDSSVGHHSPFQDSFSSRSIAVSTTSSTSITGMQDSEMTVPSQASTRATTPDSPALETKASISSINNMTASQSSLGDTEDDGESKVLEKTFAHELMHNKDGQITGGTLPALVEKLTTHDSTPDAMFVTTFYLTFRLFVTPVDLAKALVDRFDYVAESPRIAGPVRLRVYNIFKGWMESHWRDITDHDALPTIESFAEEKLKPLLPATAQRLQELSQKVSSLEGCLVPRLVSSMGKTSTANTASTAAETPVLPPVFTKSQMGLLKNWKMGGTCPSVIDFDPLEIARQLAIKEMNIFCAIMPEELLGSEWTKKSGSNAVNVRAMSTLSTDLSNLVADTILQYDDVKKRAVTIKHWIKIAQRCLELNNYHSLMAIICSLNSSTIVRLRKTWDNISQKRKETLNSLQAIVEPDKNYAVLRRRLSDHVAPCLPFVGLYLTDLTFIDAGNPATKQLPGIGDSEGISVINFDKHSRTAKIIGELQRFQVPYRLAEVTELQEWLQAQIVRVKSASDHENVTQYYRKSLLLEPRETLQKQSPVEPVAVAPNAQKDKFDIFGWTHLKVTATS
ncbi:hypothetical protein B7463_g10240, partial [Scytalidium lignicola]